MEVDLAYPAPSATAIADTAMNHLIPRSVLAWKPAFLQAHTLRITADDLAQLSSKGATDDSNFKRPTAVYVTVPIVTICLGICSLYCYLQWKKSLVKQREKKLEKVAQRRRRNSMKQGAATAASTGSAVSAGASSLITLSTVASAPPAVLGLVTEVEIVDKMILEFESPQCGASMPQQHLVNVDDKTYNVTINPLYNCLQSGACGYVRSGADIKNKDLAITEEIHRRSTLLINFQNTPFDNLLAKSKVAVNNDTNNHVIEDTKDRFRSLPLPKTQRDSLSHSKTRGQSTPPGRGAIKNTPLRPLSRLSQVSSSSTPASPRSPTASAAEQQDGTMASAAEQQDGTAASAAEQLDTTSTSAAELQDATTASAPEQEDALAKSSSFSDTSGSGYVQSSSSTTTDVGSMSKSSSGDDLDSPTISKFMEDLAPSSSSPRKFSSAGPSKNSDPASGSSGADPSQVSTSPSFVIDSKSPEGAEGTQADPDISSSPAHAPLSLQDLSPARELAESSSLTSTPDDSQTPVPKPS